MFGVFFKWSLKTSFTVLFKRGLSKIDEEILMHILISVAFFTVSGLEINTNFQRKIVNIF